MATLLLYFFWSLKYVYVITCLMEIYLSPLYIYSWEMEFNDSMSKLILKYLVSNAYLAALFRPRVIYKLIFRLTSEWIWCTAKVYIEQDIWLSSMRAHMYWFNSISFSLSLSLSSYLFISSSFPLSHTHTHILYYRYFDLIESLYYIASKSRNW